MKAFSTLTLALMLEVNASAYNTNDYIQNGSFTNGFSSWTTNAPATVKFLLTTNTPDGATAASVTNRSNLLHTLKQDLLNALTNDFAANGRTFTTRYRIRTDAPAATRLSLTLTTAVLTNKFIIAEQVVRTNGVWLDVRGTLPLKWTPPLLSASLAVEVSQIWNTNYPGFTITGLRMHEDRDADGIPDAEEITTSADLADTDGDGLPDLWEIEHGLNPTNSNDALADPDHDGFNNWTEFACATEPLNTNSFPGRPANTNLTTAARAVLTYLATLPAQTNNRVLCGQHVSYPFEFTNLVTGLFTNTGYWPGLVEFQYDDDAKPMQVTNVNPLALAWWQSGGILAIKFNPRNPWTGGSQQAVNNGPVDLPGLLDPAGSAPASYATNLVAHNRLIAWLDEAAAGLAELQSNNVPVIYRTLAEQNGRWFWWGGKAQADYVALWRFCYDYFTQTKGLNNLIWTLESDSGVHANQPSDYYYPGDDYVDVFSFNMYWDVWDLPFAANEIFRRYGKVFAQPQAGSNNNNPRDGTWSNTNILAGLTAQLPRSSWFGVWNSFTVSNYTVYLHIAIVDNPDALALMTHPWIATREEVNWKYWLPFSLSLDRVGANQLCVNWQGGALQHSTDLVNWTNVANATQPYLHDTSSETSGFWRLLK